MADTQLNDALRSLFEQGRDAMFITDQKGRLTHVNPAFMALYQYDEHEIIGKPMRVLLQASLHDVLFYKNMLRQLLKQGSWVGELHAVSKSGEIIAVWTQIVRVQSGFSALQVDLRERDKIARKMDRLSRLQTVATLAGGIAHEFNNIFGGIQGHLYLFKQGIPAENEKDLSRLSRIDVLMKRATALVQNLLFFSKQKATSTRDVALQALLEEVMDTAKKSIDKRIALSLDVQDRGLIVSADPVLLKHHIFELINNAADALAAHRDEHMYGDPECIDVQVSAVANDEARITILDNGPGMDQATLQHCFDPFFTTQPVGQGTGLGLSSVMAYVQQLHGTLDIESIPEQQTLITIHLPLAITMMDKSTHGGVILLVDDDDDLRQSLDEILCYHGYDVLLAKDGAEGLALWQEYKDSIHAVVMDIIMPNMDGIEVARAIRQEDNNIPVCLMTGYSYQRIPSRLHVNLIRKPLSPELLLEYLERTIRI